MMKILTEQKWIDIYKNLSPEFRLVLQVAIAFFTLCLILLVYRHYTFYDSYDQALFNQIFWNSMQGRLFEGSLTSSLSANVVHGGNPPEVFYRHLGQHFNPIFLLWLCFYAVFPSIVTLVVIQVTLVTTAGIVLFVLARQYLDPKLSAAIAISFYGANAVLGSTLSNFHDYSSLPLFLFTLFLALEKKWWWLFVGMAILTLTVREDAGVALFSFGIYLILSRRYPRIGLGICTLSLSYILIVTHIIMPQFSADVSERMVVENFGQFTDNKPTSTIGAIWAIITHPIEIFQDVFFVHFDRKFRYLLGHLLPLAFIPIVSVDTWLLTGFPFLQVLLMDHNNYNALSINIRYTMLIVPGLFYGVILWWAKHSDLFQSSLRWRGFSIRWKQFLKICVGLSLFFTLTSNPGQSFSCLIPDYIIPWAYINPISQWYHVGQVHQIFNQIPDQASVAAPTILLPTLSYRRAIIKFPYSLLQFRNDDQQIENIEYVVMDIWRPLQYQIASRPMRNLIKDSVAKIDQITQNQVYGIIDFREGVILLRRSVQSNPTALANWLTFRETLVPVLNHP